MTIPWLPEPQLPSPYAQQAICSADISFPALTLAVCSTGITGLNCQCPWMSLNGLTRSAARLTLTDAHGAVYDDDNEDFSPEEDGDSVNEANMSEQLVD